MQTVIYSTGLFPPGQIVATQGAAERIPRMEMYLALSRHLQGDWGVVSKEDKQRNDAALCSDERLFSAYQTADNVRFCIITEADRSATTILLPDEY